VSTATLAPPPEPPLADGQPRRPVARAPRAGPAKWQAALFSVAMLGLVAAPVLENWKAEPRDSFPLSYYRMFSEERADRQRLTYLVALDGRDNRHLIPHQLVG
jgi:hypothetical protein